MKIKTTKQVSEEIEIETPAFLKGTWFTKITDKAIIEIVGESIIVTNLETSSLVDYKINEALNKSTVITEEVFNEKFFEATERIKELASIHSFENVLQ